MWLKTMIVGGVRNDPVLPVLLISVSLPHQPQTMVFQQARASHFRISKSTNLILGASGTQMLRSIVVG